jgi:hypothetical protein
LKAEICTKCGMAPIEQRLSFGGQSLEDARSVGSDGICNGSSIPLVHPVSGGI